MSSPINPYESPRHASQLPSEPLAEYMEVARRPKIPLVVGIISLIFGSFGLLGNVSAFAMYLLMPPMREMQRVMVEAGGYSMNYLIAIWIVGTVIAVWLIAAGIGLVRYRAWGRKAFNIYGIVAILMALIGAYMAATQNYSSPVGEINTMENELVMVRRTTAVVTNLMGMLFPVLGMIFLNRSRVAASLK